MKVLETSNGDGLFIDIGQTSLQAVQGEDAFAFPIERGENGRLTDLCRERLILSLRGFLSTKGRAANRTAFCAIGARGVSIRRLSLPASSEEELQRVLRLQIESEFPLSPDELAWGSRPIGPPRTASNGGPALQELLVVAVKKEVLVEYDEILAACGVAPSFTLAALARAELQPPFFGSYAVLDIGRTHSELVIFDNGAPVSIRILAWGGENMTRSIKEKLGITHDEAEKLKMALDQPGTAFGSQRQLLQAAAESALAPLAALIKPASLGQKLYLTGKSARDSRIAPLLAGIFGNGVSCESLEQPLGASPTAAIAGLKKSAGKNSASSPLILALNGGHAPARLARPAIWKWAAAAALLALAALIFPYAEAIVLKPFLEKKLAALESDRGRLATIDQELDFLKFLKQNQPPYLDAVYLLAKSAPPGTHLEELSMGRHQEVAIRLKMGNAQQVSDFRSKLVDSGWFGNVVVEDQSPTQDRRVDVRMTAELKPVESRKPLPAELPSKKKEGELAATTAPAPVPVPSQPAPSQPQDTSAPIAKHARKPPAQP
jgi:type IV pilus assembly protein PilM